MDNAFHFLKYFILLYVTKLLYNLECDTIADCLTCNHDNTTSNCKSCSGDKLVAGDKLSCKGKLLLLKIFQ